MHAADFEIAFFAILDRYHGPIFTIMERMSGMNHRIICFYFCFFDFDDRLARIVRCVLEVWMTIFFLEGCCSSHYFLVICGRNIEVVICHD